MKYVALDKMGMPHLGYTQKHAAAKARRANETY